MTAQVLHVEIPCGDARHLVTVEDGRLLLPDHDGSDELLLAALGAPGTLPCLEVRERWRVGRLDGLPRELVAAAVDRWVAAGIARSSVHDFVAALRAQPPRVDPPGRNGSLSPAVDAALWCEALGRPPTPEDLHALHEAGVADSADACAWAAAFGRPLEAVVVTRSRSAGIIDGHDALLWRRAVGAVPGPAELRRWRAVEVHDGWDAMCWAEISDGVPTADSVAEWRRRGLTDPPAVWAARHG